MTLKKPQPAESERVMGIGLGIDVPAMAWTYFGLDALIFREQLTKEEI